ncbi:hypothetical protein GYH30_047526 [Glycine max]|uniref:Uncharacterized protein n=2 Tax=Glycine subgen. Soja TaxID=1462606 RepID=K7MM22_SOYBN|nr:hypothetical protein GYH30_047526 [Glycine max]RZB57226.1 hypothetical protein D0Y65_046058 [Glycine soja]
MAFVHILIGFHRGVVALTLLVGITGHDSSTPPTRKHLVMLNSPSSPHHHQEAVRTVRAGGEVHGGDEELRGGAVEGADEDRAKIVVAKALGEGVGGVAAEDGEGEAVRQGGDG